MKIRTAAIIVCVIDAAAWGLIALASFASRSDAATRGLDHAAGLVVTALFLVTAVPAITMVFLRRAPMAALVLALAFPVLLVGAFLAAVMAFA